MKIFLTGVLVAAGIAAAALLTNAHQSRPARITIDYPLAESIFPPDISAPTFIWRDADITAQVWAIEVSFGDGSAPLRLTSSGEPPKIGEIDPRCVGPTNKLPELTAEQAAAHTWRPEVETWSAMKRRSSGRTASIAIEGYADTSLRQPLSHGELTFATSNDPVGAPIFYRDVPLMPSELQKGVIKPIAPRLLPFIVWKLRDVRETESRVVMEGLHTCANCHSFSRDGSVLGMDLDGPHNDKGLYAIVPVSRSMSIHNKDVISWKSFRGQTADDKRIGFMSQVSPDGKFVMTATQVEYYVANFKDYRFLQVFYPTRGILAYYSQSDGQMRPLPGADDPAYVQANAVWSPDGSYVVFARAPARDSDPESGRMAEFANDPNEVPIQYDLYRIPFNGGSGGRPAAIAGASRNGMSNSFPKISPDGRWIVFVQCRNGQLMRPDGQLYIVPAAGGRARRMRCNTPLMNSWHSFSPNGRWMVFASKSRTPYTQMFLTHIDENGNDSPAVFIENATAANRAVNIPEFVNVGADALQNIDAPATEFYRLYDLAWDLTEKGDVDVALGAWAKALEVDPEDAKARNNFAGILLRQGKLDQAIAEFERVLRLDPKLVNARNNLGLALLQKGSVDEAIAQWHVSLQINRDSTEAWVNLGNAFMIHGKFREAIEQWQEALRIDPNRVPVLTNIAWMLATCPDARVRDGAQAVQFAERALRISGKENAALLDVLGAAYAEAGRFAEAIQTTGRAVTVALELSEEPLVPAMKDRIRLYEANKPFRENR